MPQRGQISFCLISRSAAPHWGQTHSFVGAGTGGVGDILIPP
jgi:hypothetical protein